MPNIIPCKWRDLDGDGKMELPNGKRYRAHNGKDPERKRRSCLSLFSMEGTSFTKNMISYAHLAKAKVPAFYSPLVTWIKMEKLILAVSRKGWLGGDFFQK